MALNSGVPDVLHGLSTGALFFLVGVIYERAHLCDLKMFGGLSSRMPYYYGLFAVCVHLARPAQPGRVLERAVRLPQRSRLCGCGPQSASWASS